MASPTDRDCSACRKERLWRHIGVVTWASFLVAGVETMFFFAFFDPALLGIHDIPPEWQANRLAGYTFGFFVFWIFSLIASSLTAYLLSAGTPPAGLQDEAPIKRQRP